MSTATFHLVKQHANHYAHVVGKTPAGIAVLDFTTNVLHAQAFPEERAREICATNRILSTRGLAEKPKQPLKLKLVPAKG